MVKAVIVEGRTQPRFRQTLENIFCLLVSLSVENKNGGGGKTGHETLKASP